MHVAPEANRGAVSPERIASTLAEPSLKRLPDHVRHRWKTANVGKFTIARCSSCVAIELTEASAVSRCSPRPGGRPKVAARVLKNLKARPTSENRNLGEWFGASPYWRLQAPLRRLAYLWLLEVGGLFWRAWVLKSRSPP